MSKLDELIQELCPNGVEYKTLGEIASDIYRGSGIKRDQVAEEGTPCVRYFDLSNIQTAVFEYNGILTILPVSGQRPATPNDMSLSPRQELLFTELIMDGRILEGNLKRMGLDRTWLNRQLGERGIHSPREVFLAVCDPNLKLVLFKNIQNEREGGGREE